MSITVSNPDAAQDSTTGLWHYTATLTLPDGSQGTLDEAKSNTAHQLYLALITSDVVPAKWANGAAGPVIDVDVARFLGGLAAVEQYAARQATTPAVTDHTGPDLTT